MIKVITYNLRCASDPNGHSIDERAPRFKTVMNQYDADLVGLQEVVPRWMEHLTEDFGAEYEIFNKYRATNNFEGTPIMWKKSKYECLDKGYFWLSSAPGIESKGWDVAGCKRICLWAKLLNKEDGSVVAFFNTHYGFSDPCQIKSGELILEHIREIGVDAAILTADFNMQTNSPGYKTLAAKLVDVNAATVNDEGTTYHGYYPDDKNFHIDFCFVTPGTVTPITSKRMTECFDGKYPSDHFGVYSEIEVHNKLKLISFNVQNNGAPISPEDRARMLRSLLRKQDADVIGLQEVTPVFEEKLKKISRYEWALQYRTETSLEGTPILWNKEKLELVHKEFFWLSETPEVPGKGFGGQYPRVATLVVLQYRGSNKKFCYVNTHFDFSDENHIASANLIKEKVASYGDIPVFVTADFNMHIGSAGYKAMREFFKDVRWEIAPRNFTPTFNGLGRDMLPPTIIDFVFTNGVEVVPTSYTVLDEMPKGEYISNHNGICAEFIVK